MIFHSSQHREAEQRAALAQLAKQLESMNDVEELTTLVSPRPGQETGVGQKVCTPQLNTWGLFLTRSCEVLVSMRNAS